MSIDNPLVIINSLTATVIKQQNEIEDLRASLKLKATSSALPGKYNEAQSELVACKTVNEQIRSNISELDQQLFKERAAAALLRSYFINSRNDLCPELAQYVVDQSIASTRDIAYSAGIMALSPIAVNLTDGFLAKSMQDSLDQLSRLKQEQEQNQQERQP